uniref:Uncharacterized protein n=1 Tax=Tanacetum cinerariifolium TaxID=118510 RepID=A0A6L2L1I3_TANCI|nr:hypothetical protein [Tanacetum cinerariifolium]
MWKGVMEAMANMEDKEDMDEGTKNYPFNHIFAGSNLCVLVDKTKYARNGLKTTHTDSSTNEESRANDISKKIKLEDLSEFLKDIRSALFTPDSPQDDPIIVTDKSEEEEADKEDTHDTSHDVPEDNSVLHPPSLKSAQIQKLMAQARPSYPNINQLIDLLVTSLKPALFKLLASHNFASCLPTKLKELPSKFTDFSGEIKELKKHVKDIETELPGDLNEIPTKLETFTSTISSHSSQVAKLKTIQWELLSEFLDLPSHFFLVQEKLKALDSLPSLLNKVTKTLNKFATVVETASGATTENVSSARLATASPAQGEKNTKDAETNPKVELVDLLGINVVTRYYNKKLLFDKYCDKMLKRKNSPKITNYKVLIKKGPITLKIYREDGSKEVILNLNVSDVHLAKWREVIQACPNKSEKGWKTICDIVKTILDQLT